MTPTVQQLEEYDALMQADIDRGQQEYEDHLMELAQIEQEIERAASRAFHFPVSHGPNASYLSAQWDWEDEQQEGRF